MRAFYARGPSGGPSLGASSRAKREIPCSTRDLTIQLGIPRRCAPRDDRSAIATAIAARSVFHDARPLGSRDPVVRRRTGLLSFPTLEAKLGAVAGRILVREGVDRRGGRDGDLHPGEFRSRLGGLGQKRAPRGAR